MILMVNLFLKNILTFSFQWREYPVLLVKANKTSELMLETVAFGVVIQLKYLGDRNYIHAVGDTTLKNLCMI